MLSPDALQDYSAQGFLSPLDLLSPDKAVDYRRRLEKFEEQRGGPLSGNFRHKMHLLLVWVDELMRTPTLLDAVESILGPDILCWNSNFFIKEAHSPDYVSWHQDATYWGLGTENVVSAWVALSDSSVNSGCMRVSPGSHQQQLHHIDTDSPDNIVARGQEIFPPIDESTAINIELRPGQFSLHNVLIAHASKPNQSDDRRIGLAFRYTATSVRQHEKFKDSAALVRGSDSYGHFIAEPRPRENMQTDMIDLHNTVTTQ